MRRPALLSLALMVLAAGCGSSGPDATPAACLGGTRAFLEALQDAPAPVRLAGTTPISECLPANQSTGEQTEVGTALVRAATALNAAARRDPGGPESVQLGYLVGAVQKAPSAEGGIHADLLRRIEAAARFDLPAGLPAFARAYARGYQAGRSGG